jgi:hypothetical protein
LEGAAAIFSAHSQVLPARACSACLRKFSPPSDASDRADCIVRQRRRYLQRHPAVHASKLCGSGTGDPAGS